MTNLERYLFVVRDTGALDDAIKRAYTEAMRPWKIARIHLDRDGAATLDYRKDPIVPNITPKNVTDNKFYVGSKETLARHWGKATLEEAIAHATDLAREREDDQFVVQIVRVVRVPRTPVEVDVVE